MSGSLQADLRTSPTWFDGNAVGSAPDWHYRVPITVPASASVNSTIKVDIDFTVLLNQLGISGSFDGNSPRIVRSNGALVSRQEFTDSVYAGTSDILGNSRGEIRFILQDTGPVTYYLYFDVTQNGAKPAWPSANTINGNFEFNVGAGDANPAQWTASKTNAAYDAQIRPSENPSVTTDGTIVGNGGPLPKTTTGTPNSGNFSYLIGSRTNNEAVSANPGITLSRTIVVPATNPGNVSLSYRPEGWEASDNGAAQYDFLRVSLVGGTTTEIIGPTAGNYVTFPFSPNLRVGAASTTQPGYGQYNGWDTNTNGTHTAGMTIARGNEPWLTRVFSLSSFAGQTITLRITYSNVTQYRSWVHIDDVEWSVVNATLGMPEGYGVNITAPNDTAAAGTTVYGSGDVLVIRAQVDAMATATTNPVTADVYNQFGVLVATGIRLFNDGSHGDVAANDAVWTNTGSVASDPTYTFNAANIGTGWRVRVFAKDASLSNIGAIAGLVHIPGLPNTPAIQANFFNIDEQVFNVAGLITGRVFRDDGAAGGIANNGIQDGGEAGIAGVVVRANNANCVATLCSTTITRADGDYTLSIPTAASGAVTVTETNLGEFLSTGGGAGTSGGSYVRATDTISFNSSVGTNYSGLNFADVSENSFLTDGIQSSVAGSALFYSHTFIADSAGTVSFSITGISSPTIADWSTLIYRDTDCNAVIDSTEGASQFSTKTMIAGEKLCIIIKEFIPANAPTGAKHQSIVAANFVYSNAIPGLSVSYVRNDATTVGVVGLVLSKAVDKQTALPNEVLTYTITYRNSGTGAITNLVINDATPAFTTYVAGSAGCPDLAIRTNCSVLVEPPANAVGALRWAIPGSVIDGGTVKFQVRLQ